MFWRRKNVQVRPLVFVQSPLNQNAKWSLSSWPTDPDWNKNCFTFCSQMSVLRKLQAKSPTQNTGANTFYYCFVEVHGTKFVKFVYFPFLHKKKNDCVQDSNPIHLLNETAVKTRFLTVEIFLLFLLSPPQQCSKHMQISVYWATVQQLFIERISSRAATKLKNAATSDSFKVKVNSAEHIFKQNHADGQAKNIKELYKNIPFITYKRLNYREVELFSLKDTNIL